MDEDYPMTPEQFTEIKRRHAAVEKMKESSNG